MKRNNVRIVLDDHSNLDALNEALHLRGDLVSFDANMQPVYNLLELIVGFNKRIL